ncbi:MAG: DUF2065 domain-containing protein [Curvibacter sp. PD_MW3]|nr:DUF2065 domain-containing protein [Burkholderiales bacterium]PHM19592.1 MAG: DUF2065 domain-containing protein [Curvibacter sp. PD_MW3]
MDADSFWLAMALVLVIEGLFPFLSPGGWRRMFAQILQLSDGQIRFFGLCSILAGLVWLWWQGL